MVIMKPEISIPTIFPNDIKILKEYLIKKKERNSNEYN
jgi:hypothetical protein